jgi:hypothetical protein
LRARERKNKMVGDNACDFTATPGRQTF